METLDYVIFYGIRAFKPFPVTKMSNEPPGEMIRVTGKSKSTLTAAASCKTIRPGAARHITNWMRLILSASTTITSVRNGKFPVCGRFKKG